MSSNSKNIAELLDSSGLITNEKLAPGAGGTNWSTPAVQTSDFTAISPNGYFVDTSSGTITVTLPASPAKGDYIALVDYAGTNSDAIENGSYTNRIQINPNGSKINGFTSYKDISASRGGVQLVYVDSTQGWIVTDAANEGDTKALVASSPTISSVLNSVDAAWFQFAGDTITVNGTGFVSGLSVILIDTIGSTEYTASNVVLVNENQVTFDIPAGAVSSGQVAGEDPFDVKVLNSDGSYAISSDALEYVGVPTFQTSNASPLGIVTATTNDPSADAFADLGVTISAVSLDPDDTVTYAITSLPTALSGLTINSSTGALVGGIPTNGFPADDTSTNYTFTVTATSTSDQTGITRTATRNYVITLEGNVSAPTVTAVDQNYIEGSGVTITVTGTGFKDSPAVTLLAPDSTPYAASSVTFDSATQIRFVVTPTMASAIAAAGAVSGDERFDLKVTNPVSGYFKSGTRANTFEYIAAPTFNIDSGLIGLLDRASSQDYSTLTTSTLDATPVDPDDTITYSLTNVATELANLTINPSTGALSGTADLSAVNSGTYSFTVVATATSTDFESGTANQISANRVYSINVGVQMLATGGTITEITDGGVDYKVHTFTSDGTFEVSETLGTVDVEYLVIAGGGGGGADSSPYGGGGGGAGGYRSSVAGESSGGGAAAESPLTVSSFTNYTVTVGQGGSGAAPGENTGTSGGNSALGSIISIGGGAGTSSGISGITGGSGGGVAPYTASGSSGTANQGYGGGFGGIGGGGSGGGGAGSAGTRRDNQLNGHGGGGVQSNIDGTPTYRAGGGGGGQARTEGLLASGAAGGGNGGGGSGTGTGGSGGNALPNTGSGGGGAGCGPGGSGSGGAGGSGIVIVRYPIYV